MQQKKKKKKIALVITYQHPRFPYTMFGLERNSEEDLKMCVVNTVVMGVG